MTLIGWTQILLFCAIVAALARPLGGWMTRVLDGDVRALAAIERPIWRLAGTDPDEEQSWLGYAFALLAFNLAGFLALYALQRLQGGAAAQPRRHAGRAAGARLQHRRLVHDQHQLAELRRRDHHEPPHPDGRADGAELRLRRHRHRGRRRGDPRLRPRLGPQRRQLLGRPHPDHALRPAADLPRCSRSSWWRRACRRPSPAPIDATTLEGARQTIATGPVASQVAIKMLGTNGGGFFNVNAAHPFENPTAIANFLQMLSIFALGAALTNVFGRMVGNERQGWAILAAMGAAVPRRRHGRLLGRGGRQPARPRPRDRRRQHGGQGGPLRHRDVGALRRHHHGGLLRRGQRHARQLHRARRDDPARQHAARRDHRRRRRRRALRHADLRARRDLHRRADGRAHARIRRQEDRGARGQDGDARHPVAAARHARLHRRGRGAAGRGRLDRQPRPARLLGDPLRLHLGGRQQRLGLRRADRQHRLVQPDARDRDADGPLPRHHPGARHRRLARRQEDASRPRPAPCRPTAGSSSGCSSASS